LVDTSGRFDAYSNRPRSSHLNCEAKLTENGVFGRYEP
jgi:hypothetical protein